MPDIKIRQERMLLPLYYPVVIDSGIFSSLHGLVGSRYELESRLVVALWLAVQKVTSLVPVTT